MFFPTHSCYSCWIFKGMLLYCCLTAALLLVHCCFTAALLLLYCCFNQAPQVCFDAQYECWVWTPWRAILLLMLPLTHHFLLAWILSVTSLPSDLPSASSSAAGIKCPLPRIPSRLLFQKGMCLFFIFIFLKKACEQEMVRQYSSDFMRECEQNVVHQ